MYALVDCNNFYVSCERVFQPWLNNIPLVVLSNNDGCIISRSEEAKRLGIKMGEPAFKNRQFFLKHNVKIFSSNFALYGDMSKRVMNILSRFTSEIEIYSIDEAFLSFHGIKENFCSYAKKIKNIIYQSTGIPVCVGIGNTKTLSKVATHHAKKIKSLEGIYLINSKVNLQNNLNKIAVKDIWGIGKKYSYFLNKHDIYSAWQYVSKPTLWIKKYLGITGVRIKNELLGDSFFYIDNQPKPKKSISSTRTFANMLEDFCDLKIAISTYASRCAFKLRMQKSYCSIVTIIILTNRHKKDFPQYNKSFSLNINPTNSTIEIVQKAIKCLKIIFKSGYKYKKAGVILSGITSQKFYQASLLFEGNKKYYSLIKCIDAINNKFGTNKLELASCFGSKKLNSRQEKISSCYTTKWDEIIKIN